jgi:peptidoglycan/xylan/chitin deacetylase (PgdA/CDA1 family)
MWWAGIGWQGGVFEVVVLDGAGHEPVPATRVGGRDVAGLTALLSGCAARAGDGLGAVLDSTNGVLDGHLLAAGLSVHRPHPRSLPPRPAFGSVPARVLAETARADPSALFPITISSGALAGRHVPDSARCADVERELAGRFIGRGPSGVRDVAVTFDDGPDPVFTPQVLEILAEFAVPASFFCVGLNADAHPRLVETAAGAGHFVGNHTWTHAYLPDLSRDELLRQVDATGEALARVLGEAPTLARPPYGARTPDVLTWLAGHGLTTVVWDVDAGDWAEPGVDAVVAGATTTVTGGSIILMHDAGGDRAQTVAALPRILRTLLERGHRLVRVDELS